MSGILVKGFSTGLGQRAVNTASYSLRHTNSRLTRVKAKILSAMLSSLDPKTQKNPRMVNHSKQEMKSRNGEGIVLRSRKSAPASSCTSFSVIKTNKKKLNRVMERKSCIATFRSIRRHDSLSAMPKKVGPAPRCKFLPTFLVSRSCDSSSFISILQPFHHGLQILRCKILSQRFGLPLHVHFPLQCRQSLHRVLTKQLHSKLSHVDLASQRVALSPVLLSQLTSSVVAPQLQSILPPNPLSLIFQEHHRPPLPLRRLLPVLLFLLRLVLLL